MRQMAEKEAPRVVVRDEHGVLCLREQIAATHPLEADCIPAPTLEGPTLRLAGAPLAKGVEDQCAEVCRLQRMLAHFGYFEAGADAEGTFGDATEAALKQFQDFTGLEPDGVAGPATKAALMATRFDVESDKPVHGDRKTFAKGQEIKYFVEDTPTYLPAAAVKAEIAQAAAQWTATGAVGAFTPVGSRAEADLVVEWVDKTEGNLYKFDGPGGCIAHAYAADGKAKLEFDAAERWSLQRASYATPEEADAADREDERFPGEEFYVLPVALHELGHVLGLSHSADAHSVMAPFYVSNRTRLHESDAERVLALYNSEDA